MRKVLQNAGWLLGGKGVNAGLSLVYLALATRGLGFEAFGQFVLIVALGQAVTAFATFQTWQVVVRWGSRDGSADDVLGFAIALDGISLLAGALLAAAAVYAGGSLLPLHEEQRGLALLYCLVTLVAIRSTPIGVLRLHDRYAWSAAADSVTPSIRCFGAALAAVFAPTVAAFLAAWAAAELATAAVYWRHAARCRPFRLSAVSLRRLPARDKEVWRFVWSTNLSASTSNGFKHAVLLLVGVLGGAALAGVYRVAVQLGQALLRLSESLLRAIYPELVRDQSRALDLAFKVGRVAAAAALAAVALAAVAGHWLVEVIAGKSFAGAFEPMIVLALAAGVELAAASFEALLVAKGQAGRAFVLRAVPVLGALLVLPSAISALQATGAALAVLAASAVTALGYLLSARALKRTASEVSVNVVRVISTDGRHTFQK